MKKVIKEKGPFSDQIITLTVSKKLNKLTGQTLAPKKLAAANEILRKTPTEQLDKILNNIDDEENLRYLNSKGLFNIACS
ncbi:MAG: hypothetical protein JWQ30_2440 [Sediminibacterium sp.]|nr:hypothetical protein [Sediminibacterium sp.]